MISLRSVLTFFIVLCSLLPAYWVGTSMIQTHQADLMEQKKRKLENANQGIKNSVAEDLSFIANLTSWYSKDRLLVQAMDNRLLSSAVWQMLASFEGLATDVSSVYVLDKNWQPMFETNGSIYHIENSRFLQKVKKKKSVYQEGKILHTSYFNEGLVSNGGQSGIALVSPLIPFMPSTGTNYESQGYLVVLVAYKNLVQLSQRFLYKQESLSFHYGNLSPIRGNETKIISDITVKNRSFIEPLQVTMVLNFSNYLRNQELVQSKHHLNNFIVATLVITLCIAVLISQWLTQPIRKMELVVRSFEHNQPQKLNPKRFKFKEFERLMDLLDSLWLRLTIHMDELEVRNRDLYQANQQVQRSNAQLADFNQELERRVAEQMAEVRANLSREEAHKIKLMSLINFTTGQAGVGYHAIPEMINLGLERLLPGTGMHFSFHKQSSSKVKTMYASTGGVLGYFDYGNYVMNEEEQILLELFKKQLYSWLELEDFARRDTLTCCFNRKAFDEDYKAACQEIVKGNWGMMAIIVIDLNGLKVLNDNYGHDRGDVLIERATKIIKSVLQEGFVLYRIGGDEFAIIARELDTLTLVSVIEKLESAQNNKWVEFSGNTRYPIKFSVGGASSEWVPLDNLFSVADEAMYEKKREYYSATSQDQGVVCD